MATLTNLVNATSLEFERRRKLDDEEFDIVDCYLKILEEDQEISMPIAAIQALLSFLRFRQPSTQAELIDILKKATNKLKDRVDDSTSLSAGCDLFLRYITRNLNLYKNWDLVKIHLIENGNIFLTRSKESRSKICKIGYKFIKDGDIILVHSFSRVVLQLLVKANEENIRFRAFVTEAKPSKTKYTSINMVEELRKSGIPTKLILDSSVGYVINKIDKILVGAEGVLETGGVVNHIGTYQIGLLAKTANKPLYVAAESHKFVREFPLSQDDFSKRYEKNDIMNFDKSTKSSEEDIIYELNRNPKLDFTPPDYVTALITDLGVLTPSAVSHELIKMWYD
ncbi:translation initiation factor eIF2B subunit alpha [Ascoidea rubescens DSM 1968]|uniref:Translation initiation factor eIF2B subunit alpha n=1 Tax=Ascoidea rubescens DSM 1968 TaxID=1344418 RepID=A0A1D2VR22_9ASCO|nr:alpha subunit of the translation initiation factor eIF2B [Ascoidea rubescens DSM 1968]ODV64054.1 alpha subunit of the translation initiation factor eIF2B [Ascoidea rubescens DSM 1968]